MASNLPTPAAAAKPYFAPIDGVRSLCVLLVMLNHLRGNEFIGQGIDGYLGVDIFFVISGFLITTLLLREERVTGRIDISAFYWRRFFRIIPIYSVVLLAYVAVCQLPSLAAKWIQLKAGLPYFLLFMNEYAKEPAPGNVFTHTWSLGVEEKFYLLWPVLFFVLVRKPTARRLMLAALFFPLALASYFDVVPYAVAYFGLLMGCVMAILLSGSATESYTRWLRRVPSPVMLLVFLLGFYINHVARGGRLLFSATTVLFLSYLIVKATWMSRVLATAPLVWLGRRSYGMYLVHVLCLNVFETKIAVTGAGRALLVMLLSYVLSAGVAAVLFLAVEEPCRKYGKSFIARRRAA